MKQWYQRHIFPWLSFRNGSLVISGIFVIAGIVFSFHFADAKMITHESRYPVIARVSLDLTPSPSPWHLESDDAQKTIQSDLSQGNVKTLTSDMSEITSDKPSPDSNEDQEENILDSPPLPSYQDDDEKTVYYNVLRVIDGDTFVVAIDGKAQTVRLLGINAPETVDPKTSVQCYGPEASDEAKHLLADKRVLLKDDPTQDDKDKYGRLLRYVFLEDGTFINQDLISGGDAREYTYKGRSYQYQSEFKQKQAQAKDGKQGLWGKCNK